MTVLGLASSVFNTNKASGSNDLIQLSGTAVEKSSNGMVKVLVDGSDIVLPDGVGYIYAESGEPVGDIAKADLDAGIIDGSIINGSATCIEIPTTPAIKVGQKVTITATGGTTKTMEVTGQTGWGDSLNLKVETLEAQSITTEKFEAAEAYIKSLASDEATIEAIKAGTVTVDELVAEAVSAGTLDAETAKLVTLEAENGTFTNLISDAITTKTLDAEVANIVKLDAGTVTSEALAADYASVKSLEATDAKIDELEAKAITTDKLDAEVANILNLETETATVEQLNSRYATVDFANIGEAAIKQIFADTGIVENIAISDGKVTGTLSALTINADNINAGTLKADRILIAAGDDDEKQQSLYYQLNVSGAQISATEVTQEQWNSLDGSVIMAKSIVAEQITVDDLTAFEATIAGIEMTRDADIGVGYLYSFGKPAYDASTPGFYMDSDGQFSLGDGSNYVRYYKDDSDEWQLDISAAALNIIAQSASGKTVVKQTPEGWVFDIDAITSDLDKQVGDLDDSVNGIKSDLDTLNNTRGWVKVGATNLKDDEGNTLAGLILGRGSGKDGSMQAGDITLQLISNKLAFCQYGNEEPVAYITNDLFHIRSGVLTEELHLGDQTQTTGSWIWKKRANEHLGLRYVGPIGTALVVE